MYILITMTASLLVLLILDNYFTVLPISAKCINISGLVTKCLTIFKDLWLMKA